MNWDREEQEASLLLDTRRKIYEIILRRPGVHLRELQRLADLAMGQLEYHIGVLEKVGLIRSEKDGRYKRLYPASMDIPKEEKHLRRILHRKVARDVLTLLLGKESASHEEICKILGISAPTLTWHMRDLVGAGLVERRKAGRRVLYSLSDKDKVLRLLISYSGSTMSQIIDRFVDLWIKELPRGRLKNS